MPAAEGVTEQHKPPRHHALRPYIGALLSLVAVVGVVYWASKQDAPRFPTAADDIALLAAAVGVYAIATALRMWRWHVILRIDGIEHKRADAYALVPVGYMGNNTLPARGGELLRVYLLGQRSSARKREILGSIVAERVLDAVVLVVLFAILTFAGVADAPTGRAPAAAAVAALILGAIGLVVYLRLRRAGKLQKFADTVRPLVRASRPLLGRTGAVLAATTALLWVFEACIFSLVADSLGLGINVLEGLFINVLASFFALIPAAPGYVGTFDAAMLFGLKALDIRGGTAVSFALLVRFILFVPITVVGGILLFTRFGGLGAIRRARKSA